jgi:hypothetical protein
MMSGAIWAMSMMLALPIYIKSVPPPPEPKPVKWVLMAVIPKADIFQYEFTSLGACKGGAEELKTLVPNAYYICVRTGE